MAEDFKGHPGPKDPPRLSILRTGSALLSSGSWGSSKFGRANSLLSGKDEDDDGAASWLRHGVAALAVLAALFLLFQPSPSHRLLQGKVNLDDRRAVSQALEVVDSEWHRAQKLQEELRQERSQLLQAWTSLEGKEDIEEEMEEEADEELSQEDIDYYKNIATTRVCPKLDPANPACRRTPQVQEDLKLPLLYVYDLPPKFNRELSKKYKRCSTDQYGTEVFFHEALIQSHVRTKDPSKADLFFVPIYGECYLWIYEMLQHVGAEKSYSMTNEFFTEAVKIIKEQHPWWNRSGGRDHVFVFPGARGPTIFSNWREQIKEAIIMCPEGDRKASFFNTHKDIVIPGLEIDPLFYQPDNRNPLLAMENTPRKHLAYFRGTIFHKAGWSYSKGLRPKLHDLFVNETDIIYGTKEKDCNRPCYHKEMTESTFCLNPLGWSPWTLRFYQAIMTRCIPVIIADDIEFPFENEIDYSKMAIKIPEKDVDDIVSYMRSMPESQKAAMRAEGDKHWLKFTYQRPPVPGDAFYSTLRELARKVQAFHTSNEHSWH